MELELPRLISVSAAEGPFEWVWLAIASGDVNVLKAAPASFDISSCHAKFGSVLTAPLQGIFNLEANYLETKCRKALALDVIRELGRRGARPDEVAPVGKLKVEGVHKTWQFSHSVTPMQVILQIRNDLLSVRLSKAGSTPDTLLEDCSDIAAALVQRYTEMLVTCDRSSGRIPVPELVVDTWERILTDRSSADMKIVCADGECSCHRLVLQAASPVLQAMLSSPMMEGRLNQVEVPEPKEVVDMFLRLIYTGCLPAVQSNTENHLEGVKEGDTVVVESSFMSNSVRTVLLENGTVGEVATCDGKGDLLIKFDGHSYRQWVSKRNFSRLRFKDASSPRGELQKCLCGVAMLASRWEAVDLVGIIEERLMGEVTFEAFGEILEVAEWRNLSRLRAVCMPYAERSSQVKEAFSKGAYKDLPRANEALGKVYGIDPATNLPDRKRARQAL